MRMTYHNEIIRILGNVGIKIKDKFGEDGVRDCRKG